MGIFPVPLPILLRFYCVLRSIGMLDIGNEQEIYREFFFAYQNQITDNGTEKDFHLMSSVFNE